MACRYCAVANICVAYPLVPFLPSATWTFLGQHAKSIRDFLSVNGDIGDVLSCAPPSIVKDALVIEQQHWEPSPDDDHPKHPLEGVEEKFDDSIDASGMDWRDDADLVTTDKDITVRGAKQMIEAGFDVDVGE